MIRKQATPGRMRRGSFVFPAEPATPRIGDAAASPDCQTLNVMRPRKIGSLSFRNTSFTSHSPGMTTFTGRR